VTTCSCSFILTRAGISSYRVQMRSGLNSNPQYAIAATAQEPNRMTLLGNNYRRFSGGESPHLKQAISFGRTEFFPT
jgi:hypothetical protein